MKYLVDQPHEHNYVYLKAATELVQNPSMRTVNKEVYACVDCGLSMEIYDLENYIEIPDSVLPEHINKTRFT